MELGAVLKEAENERKKLEKAREKEQKALEKQRAAALAEALSGGSEEQGNLHYLECM